MLFTIYKEHLLKLFKLALFIIADKKAANSIVNTNIFLKVEKEKIILIATDLEVELIIEDPLLSVNIPGAIVVPFRKISEICRAMSIDINLKIATSDIEKLKLTIQSPQGFFSVNYLLPEVFPILNPKEFITSFSIKVSLLQEMISKVAFAMGDDENRHFLNGLLLHFTNDLFISVAADGHRLMVLEIAKEVYVDYDDQEVEVVKNLEGDLKVLIPRKSVFDLLKILNEIHNVNELIKFSIGKFHFKVHLDNIYGIQSINYTSKVLNAEFPPYKRLIPINLPNHLVVDRQQLKSSCLKAAALLGDRSQGIKFQFKFKELMVIASNEEGDVIEDRIPAELIGQELAIFFNLKYLLDFLSNMNTEHVIFKFESAASGVLVQDSKLHSYYILMPMQV